MAHTEPHKPTTATNQLAHEGHSPKDHQICKDCSALMRTSAEQCRSWREASHSSVCKGGLATAAFVCDSLALSMESCLAMLAKQDAGTEATKR